MARLKTKRFRQIFNYLDQDQDGVIDLLDLTTGLSVCLSYAHLVQSACMHALSIYTSLCVHLLLCPCTLTGETLESKHQHLPRLFKAHLLACDLDS